MTAWLSQAPLGVLILVVFGAMYACAALVLLGVRVAARGGAGSVLAGVSPGLLSPMGLAFGLLVGFLLTQVWTERNDANLAVGQEASAIRDVDLLMDGFPREEQVQMRELLRRQVDQYVALEWPAMAGGKVSIAVLPEQLVEAQRLAVRLPTDSEGRRLGQSRVLDAIDSALAARRTRITLSASAIDSVRLIAVLFVALVMLTAIGCVHADRPRSAAVALALFSTAMASIVTLLLAEMGPFSGSFGISSVLIAQVRPVP